MIADRIKKTLEPSVWLEFSPLANCLNACNLGQGFPDWAPPKFVLDFLHEANNNSQYHSYARSSGSDRLTHNIKKYYSDKLCKSLDPHDEILVTAGASEALYASLVTFVNPGDEVIVIEPAFDLYYSSIEMAGGIVRGINLEFEQRGDALNSSDFHLNMHRLEETLNSKTKMIIFNTPHNPTGKVFSRDEILAISKILSKYPNCIVVSDEVYEHLVFENDRHIPMASVDGLRDRTLSIYSAGKTFSVTGWKIGWIIGPKHLISPLQSTQQWIVFSVASILQEAIAGALDAAQMPYEGHSNYYEWFKHTYDQKRMFLYNALKKLNFKPILPQGSFFILSLYHLTDENWSTIPDEVIQLNKQGKIKVNQKSLSYKDYNYARNLAIHKKVVTIPVSAFIGSKSQLREEDFRFVRFAFCKSDDIIKLSVANLE